MGGSRPPSNSLRPDRQTTLLGLQQAASTYVLLDYICATKACINNWKTPVKHQYLIHKFSQYGEVQSTNGWDRFGSLGHPSKFQRVSRLASLLHRRRSTKLCTMFGRLLGWYTTYTFLGLLPPNGILPGAKFTLRPSLAFSYIGSVTARHSSSGRQRNFAALTIRKRHLYSAGRPSRWASAHILVVFEKGKSSRCLSAGDAT